jgi:hypothetical protein
LLNSSLKLILVLSISTQPLLLVAQTSNNSDVLPNIRENVTNPGQGGNGNQGGNNPIGGQDDGDDIFIPLPGIGNGNGNGNWIGGGWRPGVGNGFNNGNRPGFEPGSPIQGNGVRVANVPGQYSCPLFENNSYQDLNLAIANLTNAIQNVTDECRSSQPRFDDLQKTNDQIRGAVTAIQGYVANPQSSLAENAGLQKNVTDIVTGIDRMADVFRNTTSLTAACGRRSLSWGRVALELNNVVNSASPFLLMLLAANPGLGIAVKSTILGSVVATNVISAMSQTINNNTIDMTVPENRNAVLQNTCQFTKVSRKIKYIQLAQTGQFEVLKKELSQNLNTLATQMQLFDGGNDFSSSYNMRGTVRNNIGAIQARVRQDREANDEIFQRIAEAQNNPLIICLEGRQLVEIVNENSFPDSVSNGVLDAYDQNNYLKNIDLNMWEFDFGNRRNSNSEEDRRLKQKVQSLIARYQKLKLTLASFSPVPKQEEVNSCAATTMAFITHIRNMINETTKIMVEDLDQFEEELTKDPVYAKWKEQFDKIAVEQENTSRMARVLKELTNAGAAVYNRSEFNEAANNLKRSLMGERRTFLGGMSPVFAWLEYKQVQYARAKGMFEKSMQQIGNKAYKLTNSGRNVMPVYPAGMYMINQQLIEDLEMSTSLKILNKKTLPQNSPQWELACIDLEKAVKDYSEALDHLGATNFMCDMIYDHLDNSVDNRIIQYCRGKTDYSGQQPLVNKSVIERAQIELNKKLGPKSLSASEKFKLAAQKMIEINCRLPRAADQN